MKVVFKKIFSISYLFFIVIFSFTFFLPINQARADFQDRCWLQKNCEGDGGVWGKSDDYKSKYGTRYPGLDQLSQQCNPISTTPTALCFVGDPAITLQVAIPGVTEKFCNNFSLGTEPKTCQSDKDCNGAACRPGIRNGFPGYLKGFYNFFVGAIAVMAVVMAMWGGFKRIAAAGSSETIKGANETILAAVSGLVIALISYTLLNLVNPVLVTNSLSPIEKVKPEFTGYCPGYYINKSLYGSGYRLFSCGGATISEKTKPCIKNEDCSGSKDECKAGDVLTDVPGDTCGKKFIVNGNECIGNECVKAGFGCFKGDDGRETCSPVAIKGSLIGLKVNYISLLFVCNNGGTDAAYICKVNKPAEKDRGFKIDVKNEGTYAIDNCYTNYPGTGWKTISENRVKVCDGGLGGLKGFALAIDKGGDWYAVDATSCGPKPKKIEVNQKNNPIVDQIIRIDPKSYTSGGDIDWNNVSKDKLFQLVDTSSNDWKRFDPIICDINVNETSFPKGNSF